MSTDRSTLALLTLVSATALAAPAAAQNDHLGYSDTPFLPGNEWRVHDRDRPRPVKVDPGPAPAEPVAAPSDAIVLFDGTSLDAWVRGGRRGEQPAHWTVTDDGAMEVTRGGAIQTKQEFGDCQLHVEWASPKEVKGVGQGRGNSGLFLMGRYEIQVLDSYDNDTYADGQAASLYGQTPPLVNACRAPGEWQTYDVVFKAPRFRDDGSLESPARVTLFHNGILVHHDVALLGGTAHKQVAKYSKHGPTGPIQLQDHGNPVRFRNIWIRPLHGAADGGSGEK